MSILFYNKIFLHFYMQNILNLANQNPGLSSLSVRRTNRQSNGQTDRLAGPDFGNLFFNTNGPGQLTAVASSYLYFYG